MSWRHFAEQHDIMAEGVKATPIAGYITVTVAGISIADWVQILMFFYVGALLVQFGWRFWKWLKAKSWRDS